METFAPARPFAHNPRFRENCRQVKAALDLSAVDVPIRAIITAFNKLRYCYTLQCCYGHFLHERQSDPHNLERLPAYDVGLVHYRIAYLALCLEDSVSGIRLRSLLEQVPEIGAGYIQFGSPKWFWEQSSNSYALQVERNASANATRRQSSIKKPCACRMSGTGFSSASRKSQENDHEV